MLVEKARISAHKVDMLRNAADVAFTVEQVVQAVHLGLAEPTRRSAERRRVADELFYCPGGATTRAVACMYDLLELPLPEPDIAPHAALVPSPATTVGAAP
jgi:hypothetical protein